MIAAFALMVIVPAAYFFYSLAQGGEAELKEAQLAKVAKDVLSNAEKVHYMGGYPSMATIEEQFPQNIKYMWISRDWSNRRSELNFWVETPNGLEERSFVTDIPIMGFFKQEDWSGGNKKIRLIASYNNSNDPYVLVTAGSDCGISVGYDVTQDGQVNSHDALACRRCSDFGDPSPYLNVDCMDCDFNGNCIVDDADGVIRNLATNGNNPPSGSFSGPTQVASGSPAVFTINANDIDGNLDSATLYAYKNGGVDSWVSCPLSGFASSCERSLNLQPGTYRLEVVIEDPNSRCWGSSIYPDNVATWGTLSCGYSGGYSDITVT